MSQPKKKASAAKRAPAKGAAATEASLRDSLAELRLTLTKGVLLTRERINETLEDAVRRGRMTRDDAEELAASLMGIGRRQAQDLLADVDTLLGSSRRRTAESTDAIVRQVDKARRAAGLGSTFPVMGYDDLTAAQIAERLTDLTPAQLRKVRDHERRNANRKSVLTAVDRALG
ncbi:MAG: hypothetical protein ACJ762_08000 [Solirubrobacteraceae bacterium]